MSNRINVTVKCSEFDLKSPIPSDFITDRIIDVFLQGYQDAISSRLDKKNYRQVSKLEYFEEYIYMEGYRTGTIDFKLNVYTETLNEFDEDYKKTIKESLMVCDMDDSLRIMSIWLEHLIQQCR